MRISTALLLAVLVVGCGRTALSLGHPSAQPDGGLDGGGCGSAVDCDDGLACNGAEQCVAGRCVAGTPPACDDGIDCTLDRCDELAGGCVQLADNSRCPAGALCDPASGGCVMRPCGSDADCDDGVFCNGAETCGAAGCVAGAPPACDSPDPCVSASCSAAVDACVTTPTDADGDGWGPVGCGGRDCNDMNTSINPGAVEQCADALDDDCDGIIDCADPSCARDPACVCEPAPELCANGADDDCDGLVDCMDPSCIGDPSCGCAPSPELCTNGSDDDCDGLADCRDSDCAASPACSLVCMTDELGSMVGARVAVGSTVGRPNVLMPSCVPWSTAGEQAFHWTAPSSGTFTIDTAGSTFDTVLYVLDGCPGPELPGACNDDTIGLGVQSRVAVTVTAGQEIVIVVGGYGASAGNYVLNITIGAPTEICTNGIDDDGDGRVDCVDPDCARAPTCCASRPEVCTDGVDQDCDSLVDCADPDCRTSPACCAGRSEICDNFTDDDCDGFTDCTDSDCRSAPICCVPAPESCTNGVDDDCDRAIDCADADCAPTPACCVAAPEVCTNGRDDDCDRRVDCGDPDCASTPACCVPSAEVCNNGRDDDCDRRIDCADPDCAGSALCCVPSPEDCTNGADDDCDARTDCADPDCASSAACCVPRAEICNNGADDDCDRRIDCGDSDCALSTSCCVPVPEVCDDGVDDDCDARIDCADPDCRSTPICCVPSTELCTNGADDDCDLAVDCADSDCAGTAACCVPRPEVCDDGADQDCDGQIDCADTDCASAPACRTCPDHDLGSRLGRVSSGTTVGMIDDLTPTCSSSTAPDVSFTWTAPFAGTFIIDTDGSSFDTILDLFDGCGGASLACDDDSGTGSQSELRVTLRAGQTILIDVDGWAGSSGSYVLNIAGLIGGETSCTDGADNDFDGAIDCADSDCAADPACAGG